MSFPVRLCALVGRFSDPRVAESVNALIPHLLSRQVKVIVSTETTYSGDAEGIVRMPEKDFGTNADLVIAIGGDGTLLYAAGIGPLVHVLLPRLAIADQENHEGSSGMTSTRPQTGGRP